MNSYYESANGTETTRKQAQAYMRRNGYDLSDFAEWADKQQWPINATDLLDWLGY